MRFVANLKTEEDRATRSSTIEVDLDICKRTDQNRLTGAYKRLTF